MHMFLCNDMLYASFQKPVAVVLGITLAAVRMEWASSASTVSPAEGHGRHVGWSLFPPSMQPSNQTVGPQRRASKRSHECMETGFEPKAGTPGQQVGAGGGQPAEDQRAPQQRSRTVLAECPASLNSMQHGAASLAAVQRAHAAENEHAFVAQLQRSIWTKKYAGMEFTATAIPL